MTPLMDFPIEGIFLMASTWAVGAVLVVLVGYKWGAYAASQALEAQSPKWKAYFLALIPPAAFALTLVFNSMWPYAFQSFWALATPAVVATGFRYNRGRQEELY